MEMVPERNYEERTAIYRPLPWPLRRKLREIRRVYSTDLANIVLLAYEEWGEKEALELADRLLEIWRDSGGDELKALENVINLLRRRAMRFGEGREMVNTLIFNMSYTSILEVLLRRDYKCPGAKEAAVEVLKSLSEYGLFFDVRCIVDIALVLSGCKERVKFNCKKAYDRYMAIEGGAEG